MEHAREVTKSTRERGIAPLPQRETAEALRARALPLWGSFDTVRAHLETQYSEPEFPLETGLSPEALEGEVFGYLDVHRQSPRVLQKANILRILLTQGRIHVDPLDFFADHLQHGRLMQRVRLGWNEAVEDAHLPFEAAWMERATAHGLVSAELDLGHVSPGWHALMQHGLAGLLKKAHACRAAIGDVLTDEQRDFYDALDVVYGAMIAFAGRLREEAMRMAQAYPHHAPRMRMLAEALARVPENAPRTLHEALLLMYMYHQITEMEGERVRSMGGFDRLFLRYYQDDMREGRLTRDQAGELISYFWIKFFANTRGAENGKNFYFGGQYADGSDAINELSYLAMDVYEKLNVTDPKLSVRVHKGTPEKFLKRVCGIIRQGMSSFVFVNDDVAIPTLTKFGKTLEEARNYLLIGCYEPAIEGLEIACNMSIKINLTKAVELALNDGCDMADGVLLGPRTGRAQDMADFDAFFTAVKTQIAAQVDKATEYIRRYERFWPQINPSPVLAGTFIPCLEKGKDIGQGGPKYNNTGCMGAGLANTADSLAAVKKLVYDEGAVTMDTLIQAMRDDYAGFEELLRTVIYRAPKWGNDDDAVDAIAAELAAFYADCVHARRNTRGGRFQASMFTLNERYAFGKRTAATPDGRLRGEYLANNIGAMTARDRRGVTAHVLSVTKLDFAKIPNGSVLDIYLHPTAVRNDEGLLAFVSLIRTYFSMGGFGVQFNIFDTETLLKAQKNPEQYATLQVRVCGWNVFFVTLTAEEQAHFIQANKQAI